MDNQATTTQTDKTVHGPKALFWFLTLFFSLAITTTSTGALWFQYINKLFPKTVSGTVYYAFSQGAIKYAIASLLIATPLFFLITIVIRKALKKQLLSSDNKVRAWITYIILFLVIAVSVGDLITAVLFVLNGDFTPRFLLKVVTILVIAAWVFTYYWSELRSTNALANAPLPKIFGGISVAVIVVSFVSGFFLVDSPLVARNKAYDQTRVNNLSEIKYSIDSYYQQFNKLPADLETLKEFQTYLQTTDPLTTQAYEYKAIDKLNYELCADFGTSNKNLPPDQQYYSGPDGFAHDTGHTCFTKKVLDLTTGKPIPAPVR